MKAERRRRAIVEMLAKSGNASVEVLAEEFGVSRMTVHRDLDELESAGLLRKIRGGATVAESQRFMADFSVRRIQGVEEKRRIAEAAIGHVEPGDTVVVDDGSTAAAMADVLPKKLPLTIITNNLSIIERMTEQPGANLIALGGEYSRKFNGFFGLLAESAIRGLRADVAFISCSAVHGTRAFHQDQEVVQCKRLKMEAAERRYLLVDHSKFGKPGLHFLSNLSDFDEIITSRMPDAAVLDQFEDEDIRLRVTPDAKEE